MACINYFPSKIKWQNRKQTRLELLSKQRIMADRLKAYNKLRDQPLDGARDDMLDPYAFLPPALGNLFS